MTCLLLPLSSPFLTCSRWWSYCHVVRKPSRSPFKEAPSQQLVRSWGPQSNSPWKAKGIRDRNCWYEARSCALVFFGFLPWDYLLSKVFMANFRRQSSLSLKNLCVKVFRFWISIATVTIVTLIKRWFLFPCFHCLKLLLSNFYSFLVVFIFFNNVVN